MVEKIKPMIADNKANRIKYGFIKMRQLKVPNITDAMPDNLNKFML